MDAEIVILGLILLVVLVPYLDEVLNRLLPKRRRLKHLISKELVIKKKLWDLEFLKDKFKAMREGFRLEYDHIKERIDASETRIRMEKEKEDADKIIIQTMEEYIKTHEPDLQQLVKQMESIDGQIDGEGGINQTIEGHRTILQLIKEHSKRL